MRQRDALPGRRDGGATSRGAERQRRGARRDGVEIEMTFRHIGEPLDQRHQIGMFAGLHETEMALGQCQRRLARHGAEDLYAERRDGVGDDDAMAFTGDAIEDHAGDAHGRIVGGKTPHHGRRRLRLARHIEHEQHRQLEMRGKIGGRAALPGGTVGAVEQPHDAFDQENIGAGCGLRRHGVEQRVRHRPGIEIDARRGGRRGMERRIDIVGSGLGRAHGDAAPP